MPEGLPPEGQPGPTPFQRLSAADLPIFRSNAAGYAAFYAPGCLCVTELSRANAFEQTLSHPREVPADQPAADWGEELRRRAERAVKTEDAWRAGRFRPECLTLYMNNECNLSCAYCHTDPVPGPAMRLGLKAIGAAAEVVAAHCRQKERPLYAVFHGGGEPSLHDRRVEAAMELVEKAAGDHHIGLVRYVATNGLLTEDKARWLAQRFDLVGLSCDGPADIHDAQRPRWDGRGSLRAVERTARILHQEGCRLHARTTITRAGLHRQAEIAAYICQEIVPEEIHFEPVYVGGRTTTAQTLSSEEADQFVAHFAAARDVAREYNIPLLGSGSRLRELHGPYCQVFRDVLNLLPGDIATACFKLTEAIQIRNRGAAIGAVDPDSGRFRIDYDRVRALSVRLAEPLPRCADCFNRYHCTRECPDICPLDEPVGQSSRSEPGFRCRVQAGITAATLREMADCLWAEMLAGKMEGVHGTTAL